MPVVGVFGFFFFYAWVPLADSPWKPHLPSPMCNMHRFYRWGPWCSSPKLPQTLSPPNLACTTPLPKEWKYTLSMAWGWVATNRYRLGKGVCIIMCLLQKKPFLEMLQLLFLVFWKILHVLQFCLNCVKSWWFFKKAYLNSKIHLILYVLTAGFECFYLCVPQVGFEHACFTLCLVALACVGATLFSISIFAKYALDD